MSQAHRDAVLIRLDQGKLSIGMSLELNKFFCSFNYPSIHLFLIAVKHT